MSEIKKFRSAPEAFFWFMARTSSGEHAGKFEGHKRKDKRPCDPIDIGHVIYRLRKQGHLGKRHIAVMSIYGPRGSGPRVGNPDEKHSVQIWDSAMAVLGADLIRLGFMMKPEERRK